MRGVVERSLLVPLGSKRKKAAAKSSNLLSTCSVLYWVYVVLGTKRLAKQRGAMALEHSALRRYSSTREGKTRGGKGQARGKV